MGSSLGSQSKYIASVDGPRLCKLQVLYRFHYAVVGCACGRAHHIPSSNTRVCYNRRQFKFRCNKSLQCQGLEDTWLCPPKQVLASQNTLVEAVHGSWHQSNPSTSFLLAALNYELHQMSSLQNMPRRRRGSFSRYLVVDLALGPRGL